jgi:hypothetical protein
VNNDVPSLSYIVDAIDARIEWLEIEGPDDELAALKSARETILDYAMGDYRNRSIIAIIRQRIARRFAA